MQKVFFAITQNSDGEIVESGWSDQAGYDAIVAAENHTKHQTPTLLKSLLKRWDGNSQEFVDKEL